MDMLGRGISSTVLILVVLVLRQILFNKVSKRVLMAIWMIPVIKLLIPIEELFYSYYYVTVSDVSSGIEEVYTNVVENCVVPKNLLYPCSIVFSLNIPDMLHVIWTFGAVLLTVYYIVGHIKCKRRYGCALPCEYNISSLQKDFGIKRQVRLLVSDRADSPFTYGVFYPVIVLPKIMGFGQKDQFGGVYTRECVQAENIQGVQLESVLCHELAHIKRFDVLRKLLFAVCTVLYWYHPFVWVMSVFANHDMELACDEAAVLQGKVLPEEYALALIGMEECRSCPQAVSFTGESLAERITAIMSVKKAKYSRAAAAAVIVPCIIVGCIVNVAVVNMTGEEASAYGYEVEAVQSLDVSSAVEESPIVSYAQFAVKDSDETVDSTETFDSTETQDSVQMQDSREMETFSKQTVIEESADISGQILVKKSAKTKVSTEMEALAGQIVVRSSPVVLICKDTEIHGELEISTYGHAKSMGEKELLICQDDSKIQTRVSFSKRN